MGKTTLPARATEREFGVVGRITDIVLGQDHIDADRTRLVGADLVHQRGKHRAPPRPAADHPDAFVVDGDDHDVIARWVLLGHDGQVQHGQVLRSNQEKLDAARAITSTAAVSSAHSSRVRRRKPMAPGAPSRRRRTGLPRRSVLGPSCAFLRAARHDHRTLSITQHRLQVDSLWRGKCR
jgi:hypothetical protein